MHGPMTAKRPASSNDNISKKVKMELKSVEKNLKTAIQLEEEPVEIAPVSKDFVIPLILKNIYRNTSTEHPGRAAVSSTEPPPPPAPIGFGLNIIAKAQRNEDVDEVLNHKNDDAVNEPPVLSLEDEALQSLIVGQLPILAQNTIPGIKNLNTDKEKFIHDISLRPNEMNVDDYQRVPIESFGVALLKGMGWKEGTAVGKNPNGLVAPIVLTPRASLLGLGATPAPEQLQPSSKDKRPKKVLPGDKISQASYKLAAAEFAPEYVPRLQNEEPSKGIQVGARVIITDGSRKGSKGIVAEIYSKTGGTVIKVKLDESEEVKGVWDDQVKLDNTLSAAPRASWLRRFIRVRIVSKKFRGGEFYNQKCVIQDVTTVGQCIVKTSKGVVLDRVSESNLETFIPSPGKSVMILRHKNDPSLVGQVATLMECNDAKQVGTVRVDSTFDIETISFDDMAEYVEDD